MNRSFLLSLFAIFLSIQLSAQNRSDYFKVYPVSQKDAPAWASLMYSEDPNVFEVDYTYRSYYRDRAFEQTIHTRNYEFWRRLVDGWLTEEGYIRRQPASEFSAIRPEGSSERLLPWVPIGPFETYNEGTQGGYPVSWQVNVYCFDQCASAPDVLYAGTEAGGLFKSTDKGQSWFPVGADQPILTVQDVKVAPSDQDLVFCASNDVIYRSTDGGMSWADLISLGSGIYQLEIDPVNPSHLYCASQIGLLRSEDGGDSWTNVLAGKVWDVKFRPETPSVVYALRSDAVELRCEFYRSDDNGLTWTQQESGWYTPAVPAEAMDIGARIAVTPADPDRVYVALIGQSKEGDNGWIGLYRSYDSGSNWMNPNLPDGGPYNTVTHQNLATINKDGTGFHQGFYNFSIAASHEDPDRLWVGTLTLNVSQDAGSSWTRIGGYNAGSNDIGWIHPDIQDLHVLGEDVWVCSDGGINYSNDEMLSHTSRKAGIYGSDYWGSGQGWNEDVLVGGRYHNGNGGWYETYGTGNFLRLGGGEAPTGYVNPLYERRAYFSDIATRELPSTIDGPVSQLGNLGLYPNESYYVSYSSEIAFHPMYADHLYIGQDNRIWKSVNEGGVFDILYEFPEIGRVLELEICQSDPQRMYCVFQPGDYYWNECELYGSTDGGESWSALAALPTQNTFRLEISVNPTDPDELWVISVSGNDDELVFQSTNGGAGWLDRTQPVLIGGDMRDVQFQGGTAGTVYTVTTRGVYYWDPSQEQWIDYSEGLPYRTRALELMPFYRDAKLRLSTNGRGLWEAPLADDGIPVAQPMTSSDQVYCARDTVQFDCHSLLNHSGASWSWAFEPEPAYVSDVSARNPKVVFGTEGTWQVSLTVTDGLGNSDTKLVEEMVTVTNYCSLDTIPGFALECINSGDYATTSNFDLTTNSFSVTAWVKPVGYQNEYSGIVMNNGSAAGLNFKADNQLGYHWPGGAWWWDSGLYVSPDEWSYVALVVTPDSVTIYLNGVASTHVESIDPVDLSTFNIGSYQGWGSRNYTGLIDEVCLWSRPLTQAEIREMRHLTRTESMAQDADLMAYYQFNEPVGDALDRVGIAHAKLRGGAARQLSSAPLGGGEVYRMDILTSGNFQMGDTGMGLLFDESQGIPEGEIVATRINLTPYSPPNDHPGTGAYWVLNNYGTNASFNGLLGMGLSPESNDWNPEVVADPALVRLFVREENGFTIDWEERCGASSVNTAANFASDCELDQSWQFYPVSGDMDVPLIGNVSALASPMPEAPALRVYPVPLATGQTLWVDHPAGGTLRIKIFDSSGKLRSDILASGSRISIPTEKLGQGVYFYRAESVDHIFTGTLEVFEP